MSPNNPRNAKLAVIRQVLQHHGLTKHGDGVVEADLLAALEAKPAEPVKAGNQWQGYTVAGLLEMRMSIDAAIEASRGAAPAAPAQVQITDEQIDDLWHQAGHLSHGDTTQEITRWFARAAIAAAPAAPAPNAEPDEATAFEAAWEARFQTTYYGQPKTICKADAFALWRVRAASQAAAPAAPAQVVRVEEMSGVQTDFMIRVGALLAEYGLDAPASPAPADTKDAERAGLIQRLYDEAQDNPDDLRYRAAQALEQAIQERAASIELAAAARALHTAVYLDWPNSPVTRAKVLKAADGVWMALNDLGTDAERASDQAGIERTESPRIL